MLGFSNIFDALQAYFDHCIRSVLNLSFTAYDYPALYSGWTLEYKMLSYVLAAIAIARGLFAFNLGSVAICRLVFLGVVLKRFGVNGVRPLDRLPAGGDRIHAVLRLFFSVVDQLCLILVSARRRTQATKLDAAKAR